MATNTAQVPAIFTNETENLSIGSGKFLLAVSAFCLLLTAYLARRSSRVLSALQDPDGLPVAL